MTVRGLLKGIAVAAAGLVTTALIAAAAVCLGSGCSTLSYYGHAAQGHLDLIERARPIKDWLDEPETSQSLRARLALTQRIRDFASVELKLPNNDSYRTYADLQREAAVWNVVAAPELSLQLKTWCFAVAGCVGYRGYFDRKAADRLGAELREQGLEVSVYGVPAYSTLGWTNWLGGDPLLNTFVHWPESELARLIFHELAHQIAYATDDTTFNESVATAVERLAALYDSPLSDDDKRARKAELMALLRDEYETLKRERWGGYAGYDGWIAAANNASFGVQAAYNELVPDFERLFERQGRNFDRFYAEVKRLASLPRDERRAALATTP